MVKPRIIILLVIGFQFCEGQIAPRLDGKIIGGEEALIEEFPYQVSLQLRNHHMCGASIISSKYALTAAHCTNGITASNLKIRAGSSFKDSGGITVPIKSFSQHPNYSGSTVENDISVLELAEDLQFTESIQPIPLVNEDEEPKNGTLAICTGWGATKEGGPGPKMLQKVKISIVERNQCVDEYQGVGKITLSMICAGMPKGGKDACQGDSGGPLAVNGKLVGIVSWGLGCGRPDFSGVYANVAYLREHVRRLVGF